VPAEPVGRDHLVPVAGSGVDLVEELDRGHPALGGRVLGVVDEDLHLRLVAVIVELGTQERDESWPPVEGVGRRVDADQRLARLDPGQEAVAVAERQVAGGVDEDDTVVGLQGVRRGLRRQLGIGAGRV
jgi:hypothetical protein